jgi:hypothetical protein
MPGGILGFIVSTIGIVGTHTILNFELYILYLMKIKFYPKRERNLESGLLILNQIHYWLVNNKAHMISDIDEFSLLIK